MTNNKHKLPCRHFRIAPTMESNTTSCTSSLSNTSTIKERNKTSGSPTIKRYNHYQNRHVGCLHLCPKIYDSPHLYSYYRQTYRNDRPIGLWSYRKLSKSNLCLLAKDPHQTTLTNTDTA